MGVLYLDESGNTGIWDSDQVYLTFGGPYIKSSQWRSVTQGLLNVTHKYRNLIASRVPVRSYVDPRAVEDLQFFNEFYLHSVDIANRRGLWSKLDDEFAVLEDVLDVLVDSKIRNFTGVLDKRIVRPAKRTKTNDYLDFKRLIPEFFRFIDSNIPDEEDYVVILDDGNTDEKGVVREILSTDSVINKAHGELILEKSRKMLPLQAADIVVWVTQAAMKLPDTRNDAYAQRIRVLYDKIKATTERLTIS